MAAKTYEKIPYSDDELKILKEFPIDVPGAPPGMTAKIYNRPITDRENFRRLYEGQPCWETSTMMGTKMFCPSVNPDNIARGFVFGSEPWDIKNAGGPDMFGVEWEYIPVVGGSMVRPGHDLMDDANDWPDIIKFPDIDSWDWEKSAKLNEPFLADPNSWISSWLLNGAWFERLVSFMGFSQAAVALIDEDQQDAVKALFEKTTDLLCRIVDKMCEYFPRIDMFTVHDDWGAQAHPFFSMETAEEMIVPYMKILTDHIHSKGKYADLHSCGKNEDRVQCYIDAGWDSWTPQPMNDMEKIYNNYGDKIIIGIGKDVPPTLPPEEQVKLAKDFAAKYCRSDRPTTLGYLTLGDPFNETLYRESRLQYLK